MPHHLDPVKLGLPPVPVDRVSRQTAEIDGLAELYPEDFRLHDKRPEMLVNPYPPFSAI